jgi:DNA-binding NarL/FixJ family response regulator
MLQGTRGKEAFVKRILIVDDHPLICEGIERVVKEVFEACVTVSASNASEAMNALSDQAWDLVIIDISIPGRDGLELLKEIRTQRPQLPVLVVTVHPEEQYLVRSFRAGASGYLSKSASMELFRKAVLRVTEGARFITAEGAELLAADLSVDRARPIHEQLSNREFDIFLRIGRGNTVGEIAQALRLSGKTVATYRARILAKTGVRNNADIAQYAIRNKLVD